MIAVTGLGHAELGAGESGDPSGFLKARKSRKYMGVQDDLAVLGAGRALASAGLCEGDLGERVGLYMAVGYIPFLESDIRPVLEASLDEGVFSMARFSSGGFQKAHPLLTFRCLPNMPAYHVSVNFGVEGPYFVTYPGSGELYLALEEAMAALREGRVEMALLGATAHQRNFLVEHHFRRIEPPIAPHVLRDAGAFAVLETEGHARARKARVLARLESLRVGYEPFDPIVDAPAQRESVELDGTGVEVLGELGPASLLVALARAFAIHPSAGAVPLVADSGDSSIAMYGATTIPSPLMPTGSLVHTLRGRGGITARSRWTRGSTL